MLVQLPGDTNEFAEVEIVGGGTLFEAMYAAIEAEPTNPHCIKLLRDGVANTLVLVSTTTDDEILFLRTVLNHYDSWDL